MKQAQNDDAVLSIESHSIDYVAAEHRHGKVRDLFTLWFCTNLAPLAVISGAMSISVFHLDRVSAILAICSGHFFGAIILALTSAQGPQVGLAQMVQSRAQFGRYGSLLVVVFTTVIYLGYFISNIILSGKTLHTTIPALPESIATIIGAFLATVIGVIGYNFIHIFNKIGAWFMGGALLAGLAIMVPHMTPEVLQYKFTASAWFSMFGFCAVWQISFAPYTSDYSRYLPASIGIRRPFWYTCLGASLGTIFAFLFGMVAVSFGDQTDAMLAVKAHTGVFGYILMIFFLLNIIGHNAMNLYGAVLSCITFIQTFSGTWIPRKNTRITLSALLLSGSTIAALWASGNFISLFISSVFALLFILAPWIAINLLDFYLVNNRRYDVRSIFAVDGGIYGRFNRKAFIAWFAGIVVQLPLIRNDLYTGVWADLFAGVDVSWLFGMVVSALLWYVFNLQKIVARGVLNPI